MISKYIEICFYIFYEYGIRLNKACQRRNFDKKIIKKAERLNKIVKTTLKISMLIQESRFDLFHQGNSIKSRSL